MPTAMQRSFAGGEIAPAMWGRADQAKYATGLAICRNFIVRREGGATNRPGTTFVCEVKDSSKDAALLKFVFNAEQTYLLLFGPGYMRVIQDGGLLTVSGVAAYNGATAYVIGDLAESGGVNYYCIKATTGNAPPNATYWYALTGSIYEIPTPYAEAHLADLQYSQQADIVYIAHPSYVPRKLSRSAHTIWTLSEIIVSPRIAAPTTVAGSGAVGAKAYTYAVTAVADSDFEESLAGETTSAAATITDLTHAIYPVVTTSAAHNLASGDTVVIVNVIGAVQANNRRFKIQVLTATTFKILNPGNLLLFKGNDGGLTWANYVSGGTVTKVGVGVTGVAAPTEADPITITWDLVDGAREYNVYRSVNGVFGFIGTASTNAFSDIGYTPDTTETPPTERNPFPADIDFPAAVGFYQQRILYGGSSNEPTKVKGSRLASYENFSASQPVRDDDALSFSLAGRQQNEIRHIVDLGPMVVFTAGGEYIVAGDANGVLTPSSINIRQQGYSGSSKLRPLIVVNTLLFVQARGSIVRDFRYDIQADGYSGRDLTIFATHFFDSYSIVDWDYQEIPHSVAWAVRSDGALVGLTYVRDHEVWGWHRHDTDGLFERVACLPEDDEDATYVLVRRTIGGVTKRYVERMASRVITDLAADAFFVDCGLTYDGRHTGATTMTLSGGTTWTATEDLTLTASASTFVVGDIDSAVILYLRDAEGGLLDTLSCEIRGYTSGTVVTVRADRTVPAGFRGVAMTSWAMARANVSGLDHLEGKTVSILADGNVEPRKTVASGAVSLSRPYAIIHVGLPIQADLQTLDLEDPSAPTIIDRKKRIHEATLLVEASRGINVGQTFETLSEAPQRDDELLGEAVQAFTGPVVVAFDTSWESSGRVCVRQDDPLPITVLSVAPTGLIGE